MSSLQKIKWVLIFVCSTNFAFAQEICNNGIDDDNDGLIDCYDEDCCGDVLCDRSYYSPCAADCQYQPNQVETLALEVEWISGASWHSYNVPLVGDIDKDGIPEVIGKKGVGSFQSHHQDIQIIDGATGNLERTIATPKMHYRNSYIAIADIDLDGFGEIIMNASSDNSTSDRMRIFCYEHNGLLKWRSSTPYGYDSEDERLTINLTDFNEDCIPEIFIGNQIFNAQTGEFIVGAGNGANGGYQEGRIRASAAAVDVLADNFCTDCEGKEFIVGNQVYSVDIDNQRIAPIKTVIEGNVGDGLTSIADMDLDGDLDAVVAHKRGNNLNLFIWDVQEGETISDVYSFTTQGGGSTRGSSSLPNIADFDNDGKLEIGVTTSLEYRVFDFDNNNLVEKWRISTSDGSAQTGATVFDFEGDGKYEVLYRDENNLRIMDGSTGVNITTIPCGSNTGTEYPVVADVDADGESELLCSCDNQLRVFGSGNQPWVYSRQVWHQYLYYNVNVNDDLTIPCVQQEQLEVGNGFILNNYLSQYSNPEFPVADASISIDSSRCEAGARKIFMTICNEGDIALSKETPISVYDETPNGASAANVIGTYYPLELSILPNECLQVNFNINTEKNDVFFVINDDASIATPYNLEDDFPVTSIGECNFGNNIQMHRLENETFILDLGEDFSTCGNTTFVLDAGSSFAEYQWQDGSDGQTFSNDEGGLYWVEVTDNCGGKLRDSILITFDEIRTNNDVFICTGQTVDIDGVLYSQDTMICTNYTIDNNCDSVHCTNIVVEKFNVTIDESLPSCIGDENGRIELAVSNGTAPYFYNWNTGDSSTLIENISSGTYTVTITDAEGCEQVENYTLDEGSILDFQIQAIPILCNNLGQIIIDASSDYSPIEYSLDGENYQGSSTFRGLEEGTYTVYIKDDNNCMQSQDNIVILSPDDFFIETSPDTLILIGDTLQLFVNNNIYPQDSLIYDWQPQQSLSCTDCPNPLAFPSFTTTYTVTATDPTGCIVRTQVQVEVDRNRYVYIPNTFTPNGDGLNDYFHPFASKGVDGILKMQIFDRWGALVFEQENFPSNDSNFGWDGQYRGKAAQSGVYVYQITVKFNDNTEIIYAGDLTLTR